METAITTTETSNNRSYCYRHRPDLASMRKEASREYLYKQELSQLPASIQKPILDAWATFNAATPAQRRIILQGLIATCCTSQLSFLASSIEPLLRIDMTAILPPEICVKIFSYLDAQSLCVACQVSRRWKSLADDDSLWHRMCQQHIDKKCHKCGWGLPLLQKRRIVRLAAKRPLSESDEVRPPAAKRADRRKPWKQVYSERLVVERNWRKHRYTTRSFKQPKGVLAFQYCDAQNLLITGSIDKTATVWDLEAGQIVRTLTGHTRAVRALQFDDNKLVTGSLDHTLKIWNYHTGQCIRTLECHTDGVAHLHFDSRILASASDDATIKIWNFETGRCSTLIGHQDKVTHLQIYQHNHLVSSSADRTIRLWDLETQRCIRTFEGHMAAVQIAVPGLLPRSCFLDHDAPVIVSGSSDNTIKIWSLETGQCLRTLFGHAHGITALSYDKLRLVSGSVDGTVRLWDIESGLPMYSLSEGGPAPISSLRLSDSKVIAASDQGEITVWDFGALGSSSA
ncbi:WD40-repeat-containing domain protein [Dichotomocladium elegans]|nr:WD40-repeat-containing domain protein [Dichotomocladium elegans]